MLRSIPLGLAVAALAATGAPARSTPTYSWGKPGSTRALFEGGSRACMLKAAGRDVAGDDEARKYIRGFEVLERENNMPAIDPNETAFDKSERQVRLRRMYRPDQHVDALQSQLQAEVDGCLIRTGYTRFALTREQERALKRLRPGSEARKAYLYTLGSDARIVEAQKVVD
ncbi:hypothetical protein [Sphingomonas sp. Leaf21]|uniref:hypothetical protein n=1 Tax=Sphingomonas sp. Leaf21 TaxID=2876550 RepID=UPI001E4A14F6|nr:hypothetical protein [Sphingomonas sp. Leaf21]